MKVHIDRVLKAVLVVLLTWMGGITVASAQTTADNVYVVTETGDGARLKVVFHQYNGAQTVMYVRRADIGTYFNTVVYNPGAGELPADVSFRGWTTNSAYGVADLSSAMTIDGVRTDLQTRLNASFHNEDEVHYYAMLFKHHTVTYLDEEVAALGSEEILYKVGTSASLPYTISMDYTPIDDDHSFAGWEVQSGSENVVGYTANTLYHLGDDVTVSGDVVLFANVLEGHWLVFDENGKGGTYNAPQFVRSGQVTQRPIPDSDMKRLGYTFGGWYTDRNCTTGNEFTFGRELSAGTTIYAKWNPVTKASYTVIFWTQNLNRTGYEVRDSRVVSNATVGQTIPYTSVENGDEDYVTGFGNNYGHYTGFCLTNASKNQSVTITPEGDAVLNLYYDRILYNFKFYLYRTPGGSGRSYSYPNGSGTGSSLNGLVTWHNSNNHPTTNSYTLHSETNGGYTYYYFSISAYYGEDISSKWPKYSDFIGADNRNAVSYVMMVGTKLKPSATSSGSGTLKGIVAVMDENILGATNNSNGNYVMVRFPNSYSNWKYHIWFETIEGEDYTGKETKTYNGKTYYKESEVESRSSNTDVLNQNPTQYTGFDFLERKGQNWANSVLSYWTTSNPTTYNVNFIYNRQQYKISYFDGNYVDGDGNQLQNKSSRLLKESPTMGQGATIADEYKDYVPDLPAGESGYVFEGWYLDEGCTAPYVFDKMTVGGITVYAKWRQIQYRVFLHPNAGTQESDPSLDWGSDSQQMNFRIAYNGTVSSPTGQRIGWKFVGWFTDSVRTKSYMTAMRLNDNNTSPYDKTVDFTDPMDKWGNLGPNPSNSDIHGYNGGDRFWITQKLDLYAKWRKVIVGAIGINVVYDAGDGTNPPTDAFLYLDDVDAVAGDAPTAPSGKTFSHWVVQRWNGSEFVDKEVTVYPGAIFGVLLSDSRQEANGTGYTYTVRLRAEYVDKESPAHTSITWYKNDGTGAVSCQYTNLLINEARSICAAPTRSGYTFKGWSKVNVADPAVAPTSYNVGCTPDFLCYNGGYKHSDCSTSASQVAADIMNPHDYLYAVWHPVVTFNFPTDFCLNATEGITLPTQSSANGVELTWTHGGSTVTEVNTSAVVNGDVYTYTTADGCVTGTISINVHSLPTVTLTPSNAGGCSVLVTVSSSNDVTAYSWDEGVTWTNGRPGNKTFDNADAAIGAKVMVRTALGCVSEAVVPSFNAIQYTISVEKAEWGGSGSGTILDGNGNDLGTSATLNCGATVTLHAELDDCSKARWQIMGQYDWVDFDPNADVSITVTSDNRYRAVFERSNTFTVTATVSSDPECDGTGTVAMFHNNQEVNSPHTTTDCNPVTLVAMPTNCSRFDHWRKNGEVIDAGLRTTTGRTATYEVCFTHAIIAGVQLEPDAGTQLEQNICLGESIQEARLTSNAAKSTVGL